MSDSKSESKSSSEVKLEIGSREASLKTIFGFIDENKDGHLVKSGTRVPGSCLS